jgi:uncharacterized protein DUF4440
MRQVVLAAFCLAAMVAQGSVRSDIDRQYKRWAKAAVTNDVDTILAILAPDYTLHTYTKMVIPRKDYEVSLRKRKASGKPAAAYQTKIVSVTVEGSKASVISDETSDTYSQDPITNKKLKLIHTHRYLDTWIKMGSSWRLQTTITQVEATKVVPAS